MEELWKDVNGYEGYYQISNLGRLKSFHRNPKGTIRKFDQKPGGYINVDLYKPGSKRKITTMHQLVAEHFVEGYKPGYIVNHKDGNKHNNIWTNLEWVSHKGNMQHARETGLWNTIGENNGFAKLTEQDVIEIRQARKQGISCKELYPAYAHTGMTYGSFRATYYGQNWKHVQV